MGLIGDGEVPVFHGQLIFTGEHIAADRGVAQGQHHLYQGGESSIIHIGEEVQIAGSGLLPQLQQDGRIVHELFVNGDEHAAVTVAPANVQAAHDGGILAGTQIVDHAMAVEMHLTLLVALAGVAGIAHVQIIIQAAHQITQGNQAVHIHSGIVVDLDAAQQPAGRFTGDFQAFGNGGGAVDRAVQLVHTADAGQIAQGITGQGHQAHQTLGFVHHDHHVGIGMGLFQLPLVAAAAPVTVGGEVQAAQQDGHDIVFRFHIFHFIQLQEHGGGFRNLGNFRRFRCHGYGNHPRQQHNSHQKRKHCLYEMFFHMITSCIVSYNRIIITNIPYFCNAFFTIR